MDTTEPLMRVQLKLDAKDGKDRRLKDKLDSTLRMLASLKYLAKVLVQVRSLSKCALLFVNCVWCQVMCLLLCGEQVLWVGCTEIRACNHL
jgi:hypothetical protein